jgi:hypothetical protein
MEFWNRNSQSVMKLSDKSGCQSEKVGAEISWEGASGIFHPQPRMFCILRGMQMYAFVEAHTVICAFHHMYLLNSKGRKKPCNTMEPWLMIHILND